MLPLRQRLRDPNDVHHSFRETAPAQRTGPNLLTTGPLPAAMDANDGGVTTLTRPQTMYVEEEEASYFTATTTFEEDLFLIDKGADLDSLLEPLKKESLGFSDAQPAFVPLKNVMDQGVWAQAEERVKEVPAVLARKSQAAVHAVGRYASTVQRAASEYVAANTQLLRDVVTHLLAEARQNLVRLRLQATTHLEGLLSQVERALGPKSRKVKDQFTQKYAQAQDFSAEQYAAFQGVMVARLRAVQDKWAVLKEDAQARYMAFMAEAELRTASFRAPLAQRFWRVSAKVQGPVRRALMKGRQFASRIKARQVELWVLGGRPSSSSSSSSSTPSSNAVQDLVSDFGSRIMGTKASSSGVEGLYMPSGFSMSYVSGGSDAAGLRMMSDLVPAFDDEPFQLDEVAGPSTPLAEVAVVEDVPVVETRLDDVEAPVLASMSTPLFAEEVEKTEEADTPVFEEVAVVVEEEKTEEAVAAPEQPQEEIAAAAPKVNEASKEDSDDDDDEDDHDGYGLGTQTDVEEEYLEEKDQEEADTATELLLRFGGQDVTEGERMVMEKLRRRLIMLPESLTHWVGSGDLLRYARAFDHVENAWVALRKTCYFRREQNMDTLLTEERAAAFAASSMAKEIFYFGADKEGDPVLVFRTALHHPGKHSNQEYLDYILYLVEKGRREFSLGQSTQITMLVDRKDGGLKNQDPFVVVALVPLLQQHFPGCLKRTFIAPVNFIFQFIWKIFAFVLAPDTAQRVQLLSQAEEKEVLPKFFYEDQLLTHLGGSLQDYADADNGNMSYST